MATENEKQRIVTTIVPGEAEGIRLDQYLANRFTYRSRTVWQRCIRSGEILLNGRKTPSSRPVHSGEVITFIPPEEDLIEPPVRTDYTILAETDDFLVVNKPGNLPVHPSGCYFNHTLQRLLSADLGKIVHPVNRLDRETSGVVLFAPDGRKAAQLADLFAAGEGKIRKTYHAIVFGDFPDTVSAEGFLCSDPDSKIDKKQKFILKKDVSVLTDAMTDAKTDFRCLKRKNGLSLVECMPETGRLHQIRATLCSLGYPLAGDKMYGPDETIFLRFIEDRMTPDDRALLRMERQALHASELEFRSPFDQSRCVFTAPVPADFLLTP